MTRATPAALARQRAKARGAQRGQAELRAVMAAKGYKFVAGYWTADRQPASAGKE